MLHACTVFVSVLKKVHFQTSFPMPQKMLLGLLETFVRLASYLDLFFLLLVQL